MNLNSADAGYLLWGKDLHLLLIGYGDQMDQLQTRARALRVEDRVTFTGADAEARFWMKAFDVFCFTSTDEGLPNVVMEAAAGGVPVLAWRTEFLRELLGEGQSAVLVEPGNFAALRVGLQALLENPERRRSLGEAGQKAVLANFGLPTFVRRLSDVYEELLGAQRELSA